MPLMTPATAVASFQNMAQDTVLVPAFSELLWFETPNGELRLHLEWSTVSYTDPVTQITYGPGQFFKGGATGFFSVSYAANLPAGQPTFWWPPNAVSQQPPAKGGQNLFGKVSRFVGLNASAIADGYTDIVPLAFDGLVRFELNGIGKAPLALRADHFNNSGDIRIFADFSYMIGQ